MKGSLIPFRDGPTFTTTNTLTFEARRRLTSLSCFASNTVTDDDARGTMPLRKDTTISVNYRDSEKLGGLEITNNLPKRPYGMEWHLMRIIGSLTQT